MVQRPARKNYPVDWFKFVTAIVIIFVGFAGTSYLRARSPQAITIHVPSRDLPAYHLIIDTDLKAISYTPQKGEEALIQDETNLVGHYTLFALENGQPIQEAQIVQTSDKTLTTNTIPVAIPATNTMVFGGKLVPGDVVTLWSLNAGSDGTPPSSQVLLSQVLVLDVLPDIVSDESRASYSLILAVPVISQADILMAAERDVLSLTLVR